MVSRGGMGPLEAMLVHKVPGPQGLWVSGSLLGRPPDTCPSGCAVTALWLLGFLIRVTYRAGLS